MINESLPEYIFIRICILLLHYIAPLSILFSILFLIFPDVYHIPPWLQTYLFAEALFYLLIYVPQNSYLQRAAVHPMALTRDERRDLFNRCTTTAPDLERYLSGWFKHAPLSHIRRDNVKQFFSWAFLNKDNHSAEDDRELDGYVDGLEQRLGWELAPGRGSATSLRLTVDSVNMLHRSLLWYLIVALVDTVTHARLLMHSFSFYRLPFSRFLTVFPFRPLTFFSRHQTPARTLTYWYRPHTSKTKLPVLFIHGIGIGLHPYVDFLAEPNDSIHTDEDEVGIIALEIMPISFRITTPIPRKEQMRAEILSILKKHEWHKVVLVTHSYGSVIATHLLQTPETASRIGPIVLIDPVSFLLHIPDVAYNFTARPPKSASEWQLWYFASKDPGVAHTLARQFFWAENILWREDLHGRKVTVVLCGKDLIVDTEAVGRYLGDSPKSDDSWKTQAWRGEELDILWYPDLNHSQVFGERDDRGRILRAIGSYCRRQP
ncbi:uncharacterized protein KY384_006265 [Bacidia gigantensis]|uniref:uncharacterized protein n=1 Tax=Bacidia gigantensis TaxID=2732470 RepID=UPI001D04E5B9|nr:uncharacterized protein KY384_006265 [Bacidia gigantensis]KAG8528578.1 hypothetical protein KY384_006265 [Bacidia gigantensis]